MPNTTAITGKSQAVAVITTLSVLFDATNDKEVQTKVAEIAGYLRKKFGITNV